MHVAFNYLKDNRHRLLFVLAIFTILAAVAWATNSRWLPAARVDDVARDEHDHHDHEGEPHSHDHPGHSEETSIELSKNALRNIGFQATGVDFGTFERTIFIPAIVVEQPGLTQNHITAPMTGVITKIYVVHGEAIEPGSPMFELRLTHEELVNAQRDFLQTAESLDVVNREIARLQSLGEGVIAGKRIIEQKYEKQKLEANLRAAEQALLLHGLSMEQVDDILTRRELLRSLTIRAPTHTHPLEVQTQRHLFHVQSLPVSIGEQVNAGQELAVLADHWELFVEGMAFEQDAQRLREAARNNWNVAATLLDNGEQGGSIDDLNLLYLADHVDPESRSYRFYLRLPNQVEFIQESGGRRYLDWRFKPGQRMELSVPVERWEKRIVLPVDAVVEEGAETYVYRQNGDHFDRVSVQVEYRDRQSVVIANNGSIFPGDVVAGKGAYQMHLALKNKSGGGVDPHAGHNH